jgi:hypothetical protein
MIPHRRPLALGLLAVWLLSTLPLKADPIVVGPGSSIVQFGTLLAVAAAILVEAFCIAWLLRRSRTPRFFVLWLMGLHLLTYPLFLGWLWASAGMHPALAVGIGESVVVLLEGMLIYLLCRWAPSRRDQLPLPSAGKTLLASLLGNICSALAFPLATILVVLVARGLDSLGLG